MTGTVKSFDDSKGYGFIVPDSGASEIFVHYTAIIGDGFKTLNPGDRVSFDVYDELHTRLTAKNVKVI